MNNFKYRHIKAEDRGKMERIFSRRLVEPVDPDMNYRIISDDSRENPGKRAIAGILEFSEVSTISKQSWIVRRIVPEKGWILSAVRTFALKRLLDEARPKRIDVHLTTKNPLEAVSAKLAGMKLRERINATFYFEVSYSCLGDPILYKKEVLPLSVSTFIHRPPKSTLNWKERTLTVYTSELLETIQPDKKAELDITAGELEKNHARKMVEEIRRAFSNLYNPTSGMMELMNIPSTKLIEQLREVLDNTEASIAKATRNWLFKTYNIKLNSELDDYLGNVAAKLPRAIDTSFQYSFTKNVDWKPGRYSDSGSCWMSDEYGRPANADADYRYRLRALLEYPGGFALRVDRGNAGVFRTWATVEDNFIYLFNLRHNTTMTSVDTILRAIARDLGLKLGTVYSAQAVCRSIGFISIESPYYVMGAEQRSFPDRVTLNFAKEFKR